MKGADQFSISKVIPLFVKKVNIKLDTYASKYTPGLDAILELVALEL